MVKGRIHIFVVTILFLWRYTGPNNCHVWLYLIFYYLFWDVKFILLILLLFLFSAPFFHHCGNIHCSILTDDFLVFMHWNSKICVDLAFHYNYCLYLCTLQMSVYVLEQETAKSGSQKQLLKLYPVTVWIFDQCNLSICPFHLVALFVLCKQICS